MRFPAEPRTDDQRKVEQMINAGMTFGEVEDTIEHLPAGDERKSALWLTAWSRLEPAGRSPVTAPVWARPRGSA